MSSVSSGLPNWSDAVPYVSPPVAAGISIVGAYPGFAKKTALQLERPVPKVNVALFKSAIKAAPSLGAAVGAQMIGQKVVEDLVKSGDAQANTTEMVTSSALVGGLSAYPLSVFNAQTAGKSLRESVQPPKMRVLGAITGREINFLTSVRLSEPVSKQMREKYGDNIFVDQVSKFGTGVLGSLAGHPGDTAATCWQNNVSINGGLRQLARGSATRAIASGGFSVGYNLVKDGLAKLAD